MYANPILLPQFSNREDLLLPISIFDDDLNQPISLSGTTGSGTFASWTVTAGTFVTSSVTSITIPAFPIGNQLSALALTVGTGLSILTGSPITISDVSGKNTMTGYVLSYVPSNGALICQIGVAFQFEIRQQPGSGPLSFPYGGYASFPALGTYDDSTPEITASLGNGILITDVGYAQIMIPESIMKTLRQGTRRASMVMTDSINTRQLFVASLPIISGGVTI